MSERQQKNIFLVLGPPRSGTSVMARGLNALGVALGSELIPANGINPKGFYEDYDVVFGINERVLQLLDLRWDHVQCLAPAQFRDAKFGEIRLQAERLLQKRLASTAAWCFKDPRTAKILPFWQDLFASQALSEHYIIALRHPLSVATSYQKITGNDLEHGLLLWLTTLIAACRDTQGKSCVIVSYETLMADPTSALQRIHRQLQLTTAMNADNLKVFSDGFVDRRLHHYSHGIAELAQHPAIRAVPLCLELYTWLDAVARDECRFDDDQWQQLFANYVATAPLYAYIDRLLHRQQQQADELYDLHKSRLWKLIYPLRCIDNALRTRRKQQKALRLTARLQQPEVNT